MVNGQVVDSVDQFAYLGCTLNLQRVLLRTAALHWISGKQYGKYTVSIYCGNKLSGVSHISQWHLIGPLYVINHACAAIYFRNVDIGEGQSRWTSELPHA